MQVRVSVQGFRGSGVQKFHSRRWTTLGMRIFDKSISPFRPVPKFGAKLAIIWENELLCENFGPLMLSLSLTLNVEP
jgi:hypothetical protein